jgi:hypothetical protein
MVAHCVSWNVIPPSFSCGVSHLFELCCDNRLELRRWRRPVLPEPIAEAIVGHKLAKLPNLAVERLTVVRNAMTHDIGDRMIARFAVHARLRLTRKR